MLKLRSTTRKSKVFTSNFNPILMTFDHSKLCVGNIIEPDLHNAPVEPTLTKVNYKTK